MTELITVMAAKTNDRVVIWEVHPDHPNGEVFVAGDGRAIQVAVTPAIQRKLDAGELIKVVITGDAGDNSGDDKGDSKDDDKGLVIHDDSVKVVITGDKTPIIDDDSPKVTINDGPPWDDYDTLSATVVVERLAGLTDDKKAAVKIYEAAHKNRKTVLEALA